MGDGFEAKKTDRRAEADGPLDRTSYSSELASPRQNSIETIHRLFERCVEQRPSKTALVFYTSKISYAELNQRANQMARLLREKGTRPDVMIGLIAKRSIHMIVGILAILKAGSAYVPIDPDYPSERINFMLDDCKCRKLIVYDVDVQKKGLRFQGDIIGLDNENSYHRENTNLQEESKSNDLAYVIYTSGSTGSPKGVMIEHRAVMNLIRGITDVIEFASNKKILALTTISFDISVLELILPLTQGLTVVLVDEKQQHNPKSIEEVIVEQRIDMIQMTPSRLQLLLSHGKELSFLKDVKEIMIGGEAFPEPLLEKLKSRTNSKIYNMYGPTETTVWSTISDLTRRNSVDIGKPIINTQLYIVDETLNKVEKNVVGELCIGGYGLARGYLNQPGLTDEKFIENPFADKGKIYRTGDSVKMLLDGSLKYLGRLDDQVKIRGYRIELGEIESSLMKNPAIRQAVVAVRKGGGEGNDSIWAYFVSDKELEEIELRKFLMNRIPEYMVPSQFVRVLSIPQTPNGKIDKSRLTELRNTVAPENDSRISASSDELDSDSVDCRIKRIVEASGDLPRSLNKTDNGMSLLSLGINSIGFIKIVVAAEAEFKFEFDDEYLDYGKFPDLESLLSYIREKRA